MVPPTKMICLFISWVSFFSLVAQPMETASLPVPTIHSPGQGTGIIPGVYPLLGDQLRDVIYAANQAKSAGKTLESTLRGNNFLGTDHTTLLESMSLNLAGLPFRAKRINTAQHSIVRISRRDYHDISVYLTFTKQILTEQLAFDVGLLVVEIRHLHSSLLVLLSKLDTLLKSQGHVKRSFVDSSVIPSELANLDDAITRYSRNFLLAKDVKIYLTRLAIDYATMLERREQV